MQLSGQNAAFRLLCMSVRGFMLKIITISITAFYFATSYAEVVNPETQMDARYRPVYSWRSASAITSKVDKEIKELRRINAVTRGQDLEYAYINKDNGSSLITYLVNLKSGKVIDMFPSLKGYNGIGCGKGMTRPGITKLTSEVGRGKSRKRHWGNNHMYYGIRSIAGVTKCRNADIQSDIVAHSNVNLSGKKVGDRVTSKSAGCLTVPPDRLNQMKHYAGKAYIYNAM
jgi:hypothetical protein